MFHRLINLPKEKSFFLFGPRLTGKSTLLRASFSTPDTLYVDLLEMSAFQKYVAEPQALKRELAAAPQCRRVILDEIQRAPNLLNDIHALMESPDFRRVQFIMSGSSARKLKRSKANLLGGRAWSFELFPLVREELSADFNLEKALRWGTLPKIYAARPGEAEEDLRAYVDTYLAEEVKAEALTRNLGAFVRFLPLAASENGRLINFSSLSREIGVHYQTIQEYFQILEDTLLGFWLEPYGKSQRKRMTRHPKFYFFDTGVVRALRKTLRAELAPRTPEFGELFESFIINEARRLDSYRRRDCSFSFYRAESGAEVDLIARHPNGSVSAIEIKATARPSSALCGGLLSFARICPSARLTLACLIDRPQVFHLGSHTVRALPWPDCLDELARAH